LYGYSVVGLPPARQRRRIDGPAGALRAEVGGCTRCIYLTHTLETAWFQPLNLSLLLLLLLLLLLHK
jgi:hypothetical protein